MTFAVDGEEKGTMAATILLVDADRSNRAEWEMFLQHYAPRRTVTLRWRDARAFNPIWF
jgi:hypothetical protein